MPQRVARDGTRRQTPPGQATRTRPRGFKAHAAGFVGYLIAHQAYHHGEIGVAVADDGFRFDNKIGYGMWEWGAR